MRRSQARSRPGDNRPLRRDRREEPDASRETGIRRRRASNRLDKSARGSGAHDLRGPPGHQDELGLKPRGDELSEKTTAPAPDSTGAYDPIAAELSASDQYKVKLEVFEGPLDLLLYLIKKEEVSIYDIPIARITDQYLEYLTAMEQLDISVAGEFLLMAATLIHIKSQMLLPRDPDAPENIEDPRAELVQPLV